MVLAGAVLSLVQHWAVFTFCPTLFVLVPALLGLKGNLEVSTVNPVSYCVMLCHTVSYCVIAHVI